MCMSTYIHHVCVPKCTVFLNTNLQSNLQLTLHWFIFIVVWHSPLISFIVVYILLLVIDAWLYFLYFRIAYLQCRFIVYMNTHKKWPYAVLCLVAVWLRGVCSFCINLFWLYRFLEKYCLKVKWSIQYNYY